MLDQVVGRLPGGLKLRWVKAHVVRAPGEARPDGYVDTFDYNDKADDLAKKSAIAVVGSLVASLPCRICSTPGLFFR